MEKEKEIMTEGKVKISWFECGMDHDDKLINLNIKNDYLTTKYGDILKVKSYRPPTDGSSLGGIEFYGKQEMGGELKPFIYCESRIGYKSNKKSYINHLNYHQLKLRGVRIGSKIIHEGVEFEVVKEPKYVHKQFEYIVTLRNGNETVEKSTFDIRRSDVVFTPYTFEEKIKQIVDKHVSWSGCKSKDDLVSDLVVFITKSEEAK